MSKTRLRRVEVEARRLRDRQIDELCGRMTADQLLVLHAELTADMLDNDRDSISDPEQMLMELRQCEEEIRQREAEDSGFRQRILGELDQIDWPMFAPRPVSRR